MTTPILHSAHFDYEVDEPFFWLHLPAGGRVCRLMVPGEEDNTKIVLDQAHPRLLIFREELLQKRLIDDVGRDYTDEVRKLFPIQKNFQFMLKTEPLVKQIGSQIISDHPYLAARPGTITAIMGPSGAGKSVFLKMLCGYDQPSPSVDEGGRLRPARITVCGVTGDEAFTQLGYVPQGDAMYPELTTREALRYRLLLKFGRRLSEEDISRIIKHVCGELLKLSVESAKQTGVRPIKKKLPTIDQRIGQMDSFGSYPSGGERRRINIAHELVLEPRVLILDEPTSGLSSSDSELVMTVLTGLVKAKQLTIVMTIHQPSANMFEQIDDLLLLAPGGRPAYYGFCKDAREWLAANATFLAKDKAQQISQFLNPAEAVLEYINNEAAGEHYPAAFRSQRNPQTGRITLGEGAR